MLAALLIALKVRDFLKIRIGLIVQNSSSHGLCAA